MTTPTQCAQCSHLLRRQGRTLCTLHHAPCDEATQAGGACGPDATGFEPRPKGRKAQPPIEQPATVNEEAVAEGALALSAEAQRLAVIDSQYGDGLPYDRARLVHEARFYLDQSAGAMLEAGRRLILIKEHEPYGEWLATLESIGLHPRTAQRMMAASLKFSGPNATALSHLGKTKLLELATLDDADLEALQEGGTVAGLSLDEMDRMTYRELQAALRCEREERKAEKEATDRLLGSKNRQLDDLRTKAEKPPATPKWEQQVFDLNLETTQAAAAVLEGFDVLRKLSDRILTDQFGAGAEKAVEMLAVVYHDAVERLWEELSALVAARDEVFGGYADRARPMLHLYGEQPADAPAEAE